MSLCLFSLLPLLIAYCIKPSSKSSVDKSVLVTLLLAVSSQRVGLLHHCSTLTISGQNFVRRRIWPDLHTQIWLEPGRGPDLGENYLTKWPDAGGAGAAGAGAKKSLLFSALVLLVGWTTVSFLLCSYLPKVLGQLANPDAPRTICA